MYFSRSQTVFLSGTTMRLYRAHEEAYGNPRRYVDFRISDRFYRIRRLDESFVRFRFRLRLGVTLVVADSNMRTQT